MVIHFSRNIFLQVPLTCDCKLLAQGLRQAQKAAEETFNRNPEEITENFNKHVHAVLKGVNGTRRSLNKYNGACMATNPIDRCWRCQPDWMQNRKKLADCVLGFGHKTTGGKLGKFYVVTDPSDNDTGNPRPGTLRHAVIQQEPLWIIFARSMTIKLSQELIITSHKTIDARGANVHIANGAGLTIQYVQNVIIHGLHIHDIVPCSGGMIRDSINHIGLRREVMAMGFPSMVELTFGLTMFPCPTAGMGSLMPSWDQLALPSPTAISLTIMIGCHDADGDSYMLLTTTTLIGSCMPLVVAVIPTIISQGNRFIAPPNAYAKEVTKRDYAPESQWKNWQWRSEGDLMMNGAFFVQSGSPLQNKPFSSADMIKAKPGTYVSRLTRFAGPLNCKPNQPC
ncbi:hypothetical protein HYC85_015509 [Camellia sinensis]|uniref:Pectate lyase n=1 Tax=Camellia sinensis TaxID=4442 RepID=A0A7J7GZ82_CAMSI|nr:hypothetical protein HYC85_015509 [Camellia sinensis]